MTNQFDEPRDELVGVGLRVLLLLHGEGGHLLKPS